MKKRGKGLMILFGLAIFCVVCIAVHRKSSIIAMQEESSIPAMQEESNIPAMQEESNIPAMQEESSIPDTQAKNNIPVTDKQEDNWQNHLGEVDEDTGSVVQTDDANEAIAISSEDNKYTVFVREEYPQKLYIYNMEKNKLDQIDVAPDLATDIMTLEWIDPDKVAVWSHVNPSVGCLDIYDVNNLQKLVEKYCSSYSLTEEIDTLIYVEPAPHFSSAIGKEKILNIDDEILYQTKENEVISSIDTNDNGDIAIVAEKKDDNYETESTDLVVLEKGKKKYKVKTKTDLKSGEGNVIHWINNKKISYSTRKEGVNKIKEIVK